MNSRLVKIAISILVVCAFGILFYDISKLTDFAISQQNIDTHLFSIEEIQSAIDDKVIQAIQNNTDSINDIQNQQNILTDIMNVFAETETVDTNHMLRGSVTVYGLAGLGSGTVVSVSEGQTYILTCAHVVADVVEAALTQKQSSPALIGYEIENERGYETGNVRYAAEIIKYDAINDMALLKMDWVDANLDVIAIANTYPQKGDVVYSVGNPLGVMKTISRGILSNHKEGFYFSDNTTTFGNSGGGLYNKNGELIGIPSNVMGYSFFGIPESSLGLSIDLYRIKEFLRGEL